MLNVLVFGSEADALVGEIGNDRFAVPGRHDRQVAGIEGYVFVSFDGVVDTVLIVRL